MIFRELSNAAFRFSLRRPGAEIMGGGVQTPPPPPGRRWEIQRPSRARDKQIIMILNHKFLFCISMLKKKLTITISAAGWCIPALQHGKKWRHALAASACHFVTETVHQQSVSPRANQRLEKLDADWPGGCVTFFHFTFRAAGRPHCVGRTHGRALRPPDFFRTYFDCLLVDC